MSKKSRGKKFMGKGPQGPQGRIPQGPPGPSAGGAPQGQPNPMEQIMQELQMLRLNVMAMNRLLMQKGVVHKEEYQKAFQESLEDLKRQGGGGPTEAPKEYKPKGVNIKEG